MCLRNTYYPLVKMKDGKRKVLFNYDFPIRSRKDFESLIFDRKQFDWARFGLSVYDGLNILFAKEHIEKIEKLVQVPCGCCRECLDTISREWAFRILQEASRFENNYFITFTYNDENLPLDYMLDEKFFQDFNKKFKVYLKRKGLKSDFRFYGVGEYGSKGARPHYHCIYFNLDLNDLKYEYTDEQGNLHFSSKLIEDVYGKGFVDIGSVDVGSACYVARYCEKKRRLNKSEKEEKKKNGIVPEFSSMSRRPGIGAGAFNAMLEDFKNGVYSHFVKGSKFSLPLYYSRKIKEILAGTEVLELYEKRCMKNSMAKITDYLIVSDRCSLNNYLKHLDENKDKKRNKV